MIVRQEVGKLGLLSIKYKHTATKPRRDQTCATLWSEKKNVKQYVEDATASPYSRKIITVGQKPLVPTN